MLEYDAVCDGITEAAGDLKPFPRSGQNTLECKESETDLCLVMIPCCGQKLITLQHCITNVFVFHKVALKRFLASSRRPARWGAAQKVGSKKIWVKYAQDCV